MSESTELIYAGDVLKLYKEKGDEGLKGTGFKIVDGDIYDSHTEDLVLVCSECNRIDEDLDDEDHCECCR